MKKSKSEKTETIKLPAEEIPPLIEAVRSSSLSEAHKTILIAMIEHFVHLKQLNAQQAAQVKAVQRLVGSQSEKQKALKINGTDSKNDNSSESNSEKIKKNHGRNSASDYIINKENIYAHHFNSGDTCPDCGVGSLGEKSCRKIIRIVGSPLITAEAECPETLRCNACGKVYTANMPEEKTEKVDPTAASAIAVARYGMGIPFFRIEQMQEAMGVPLAASNQYEIVELLKKDVLPVYDKLVEQASTFPVFHVDDTKARIMTILANKEERKEKGERTGIFTTGILAKNGDKEIRLFFTGCMHAGDNMGKLLEKRPQDMEQPIQMADGLASNLAHKFPVVRLFCLVHARRKFVDILGSFEDKCSYVIGKIGEVYHNEKECKKLKLNDNERLEYHKKHSAPIMEELKRYAEEELSNKKTEPNSGLGKAFNYMLSRWEGLTGFLRIPGVPMDNNAAELLLKKQVLSRKNSLFYKTEDGAKVGDVLMSIINTAIAAGTDPFVYLTTLQRQKKHVQNNPHLWLPWNYKAMLKSVEIK